METPVHRIVILGLAGRAHLKGCHRGIRAVIGNIADNREAWPAVGAVDEGIVKSPVARIHHLAQAIRTNRNIGRDQGADLGTALAGQNPELLIAAAGQIANPHLRNLRKRRGPQGKTRHKFFHLFDRALDFDGNSSGRVRHATGEMPLDCKPVNIRAEADSLHDPGHVNLASYFHAPPTRLAPLSAASMRCAFRRAISANSRVQCGFDTIPAQFPCRDAPAGHSPPPPPD